MKKEFKMTQQEKDNIVTINHNANWGMLDLAEKINAYWQELGDKYGFEPLTAEPSAKGNLFFLAEPKPISVAKTQTEIEIERYDTIEKIVEQLEKCNYECQGGFLKNNAAFLALKRMV